jgi:hypothetical protein
MVVARIQHLSAAVKTRASRNASVLVASALRTAFGARFGSPVLICGGHLRGACSEQQNRNT